MTTESQRFLNPVEANNENPIIFQLLLSEMHLLSKLPSHYLHNFESRQCSIFPKRNMLMLTTAYFEIKGEYSCRI